MITKPSRIEPAAHRSVEERVTRAVKFIEPFAQAEGLDFTRTMILAHLLSIFSLEELARVDK